jgi:predicted NAD/FAD-dependent oxidoreductase
MSALKSRDSVIIIVAGPVGLFSARLLIEAGYPVIVLERDAGLAGRK